MNAIEIESCVADWFNYRRNLIVPNVSWGLRGLSHEADLLVLSPSGWCTEVEIKITGSDIKADLGKRTFARSRYDGWLSHWGPLIRYVYFAVPFNLVEHPDIPKHAGLLGIAAADSSQDATPCSDFAYRVTKHRMAKTNYKAEQFNNAQRLKLASLGCMRIWSLKKKLGVK